MKQKLIAICLIIAIFLAYTMNTNFAATQSDIDSLRTQKQNANNELKGIQSEKSSTQDDLAVLNTQIADIQEEISRLQSQIDALTASINDKQKEIDEKEAEIKEKEELLKKRLVSMYINGQSSYLDILLGSGNYIEMLMNYDAVEEITNADTKLINQIVSKKESIQIEKEKLEEEKKEIDQAKAAKDSKNAELQAAKQQKNEQVAKLSEEEKAKQSEIDSYNQAIARVEAELAAAARRAQQQIANRGSNGLKFDGSFIWPCTNKTVTSTVKRRWGRMHKGIDIAANYEGVYASASGYAYTAEDPYGYGHYIMVFHGSGYITLYGHLSSYNISSGQYVSQGQVIATSGNSGSSQGAHLHFEIRQASSMYSYFSSSPLNPLEYLPGGYTLTAGATATS